MLEKTKMLEFQILVQNEMMYGEDVLWASMPKQHFLEVKTESRVY